MDFTPFKLRIHNQYFGALPIHPQPERLESLTRYLIRLSAANGIQTLDCLAPLCFPPHILRYMKDYPPTSFGILPSIAACLEPALRAMTFFHPGNEFERMSSTPTWYLSRSLAEYLRYCPRCLAAHPYYPLIWRFLALPGCREHACLLLQNCGHCDRNIPLFGPLLAIGRCPRCNGDLSRCRVLPLSEHALKAKRRKRTYSPFPIILRAIKVSYRG
jgi:hypothetical protein